jgi:hypothetical protein
MKGATLPEGSVFNAAGRWLRGNLHTHTTKSDGGLPPQEASAYYYEQGYDFVALSDHRHTTETAGLDRENFLVVPAIELDCHDPERGIGYHVVGLGVEPFAQEDSLRRGPAQQLVNAVLDAGGIAMLAHPYWLGQDIADVFVVEGAFALEVYNATCARAGKERGEMHWDGLLERGSRIWGVATDDTHVYEQDACQGWVMVRTTQFTVAGILRALEEGQFYSTRGPAILDIGMGANEVWVHCSPVQEVRFVGARGSGRQVRASAGESMIFARSSLPNSPYVRVECIDSEGRSAWSQPLWLKQ